MKTTSQIIELIRAQEKRFSEELREKRAFHQAAWNEYGSELCSGEMLEEEGRLARRIARLQRLAQLVEARSIGGESNIRGWMDGLNILISEAEASQRVWQEKMDGFVEELGMLNEIAELAGRKI